MKSVAILLGAAAAASATVIKPYQPCGGEFYNGPANPHCDAGYTCTPHSFAISLCDPTPSKRGDTDSSGHIKPYLPCKGAYYDGPAHATCEAGYTCTEKKPDIYLCDPTSSKRDSPLDGSGHIKPYLPCGGLAYDGPNASCEAGYTCTPHSAAISLCDPSSNKRDSPLDADGNIKPYLPCGGAYYDGPDASCEAGYVCTPHSFAISLCDPVSTKKRGDTDSNGNIKPYLPCAGVYYDGPAGATCEAGYTCTEKSAEIFLCDPTSSKRDLDSNGNIKPYQPCGGDYYDGPAGATCEPGYTCTEHSPAISLCDPSSSKRFSTRYARSL